VAYEWLIGPIPPGLVLDHLCRNPPCVNPAHLKPGTDRDNIYAPGSQVITKINGLATRCKHGHEFDTANTYVCNDGERVCRACRRERMRHYSKKAKP
jgi:hypothetical protein